MLLALVVVNGVLVFILPQKILVYGLLLTVGVAFYFWILNKFFRNNKAQWVKEPTTAICYTLAVVGTALVTKSSVNMSGWIVTGVFFLIALQNLLIFSLFELTHSAESQNFVQMIGVRASKRIIHLITIFIIIIILTFFINGREYINYFAGIELLMTLGLSFLIAIPKWAAENDRYRWLGDGVFLLPALLLLF